MNRESLVQSLLLETKAIEIKTDESFFTWTSGIQSPIYCDNRLLLSYPDARSRIVDEFVQLIQEKEIEFDCIAGVATAGIPWASFIAQKLNKPMIFVRQQAKSHGKKGQIEGKVNKGEKALVIEDLISTGKSSAAVIRAMKEEGIVVENILSVFTYKLDIAQKVFRDLDVTPYSLTNLPSFFENGALDQKTNEKLSSFWNELNK